MSQDDRLKKTVLELGKLMEWSENLKDEATNKTINRIECKRILYEITTSLQLLSYLDKKYSVVNPKDKKSKTEIEGIEKHIDDIITLAVSIENERIYGEKNLRTDLFNISKNTNQMVIGADMALRETTGIPAISEIGSFIANRSLNLPESWVIANCYLTAIDVTVNKRRAEFKLQHPTAKKEINTAFEQRYRELVEEMKKRVFNK